MIVLIYNRYTVLAGYAPPKTIRTGDIFPKTDIIMGDYNPISTNLSNNTYINNSN